MWLKIVKQTVLATHPDKSNLDKKYFLGRINSGKAIIHEMAIIVKIRKLNTIDLIKFTAN